MSTFSQLGKPKRLNLNVSNAPNNEENNSPYIENGVYIDNEVNRKLGRVGLSEDEFKEKVRDFKQQLDNQKDNSLLKKKMEEELNSQNGEGEGSQNGEGEGSQNGEGNGEGEGSQNGEGEGNKEGEGEGD